MVTTSPNCSLTTPETSTCVPRPVPMRKKHRTRCSRSIGMAAHEDPKYAGRGTGRCERTTFAQYRHRASYGRIGKETLLASAERTSCMEAPLIGHSFRSSPMGRTNLFRLVNPQRRAKAHRPTFRWERNSRGLGLRAVTSACAVSSAPEGCKRLRSRGLSGCDVGTDLEAKAEASRASSMFGSAIFSRRSGSAYCVSNSGRTSSSACHVPDLSTRSIREAPPFASRTTSVNRFSSSGRTPVE